MKRRRPWSFWMTPLEHVSILWLYNLYLGRLTPGGRVLLWGAIATTILQFGGLAEPLVYCFAGCACSLLAAVLAGFAFRPRLQMSRRILTFPTAGEIFSYRVGVRNVGTRTARSIVIEERGLSADVRPVGEPPMIELLEPGEQVYVTLKLRCIRRGAYELEQLQGASVFPAGLYKSGQKVSVTDRLLVFPRVADVGTLEIPHSRNHQPGGIAVASHVGESTEFLGMRDWRQGDRLRDIHWPSTARVGRLIAKEFQEEYFVRLAVVLDVDAPRARDAVRLERAVSLTAGITDVLARKEYIVDIFAAGDDVYHFQAGRSLAYLGNILEILACVDPGRRLDTQGLESILLPEAPRLSAVIFVMMDWDDERAHLVQGLKSQGLAVRVISMRNDRRLDGLEASEIIEVPT